MTVGETVRRDWPTALSHDAQHLFVVCVTAHVLNYSVWAGKRTAVCSMSVVWFQVRDWFSVGVAFRFRLSYRILILRSSATGCKDAIHNGS